MVKNSKFFELFGPPCRNTLADVDGSAPESMQVCALHIEPHLATLIKIKMVAVRSTNETTPQFFEFFYSPSPTPQAAMDPEGEGNVGRHCPYTNKSWCVCGYVHALLRYRSKTAKMQKFPIDSHFIISGFGIYGAAVVPDSGVGSYGSCPQA